MLTASDVSSIFSHYLASNARKGALLISGDWGTGKTFLALNQLKPIAEDQEFSCIYLSISDIQKPEDFERKLFLASYKLLSNKTPNRIANIAIGAASSWLSRYGLSVADVVSADSALSDKTVIFIDDVERADSNLRKRVLHRLAELSETKNSKIVLLADEKKIAGNADDYALIKEKTVCRTIEFRPTYEELSKTAVDIAFTSPPKLAKAAEQWAIERKISKEEIVSILLDALKQGECRNLRTAISATVDVFELVDQIETSRTSLGDTILASLIHSTLSLVIEIRHNKENAAALRKYAAMETSLPWVHLMASADPSKEYLLSFERRYIDSSKFHFLRSSALLDYLESGACDVQRILADILNLTPDETSAPAYRRLGKYRSIATREFALLTTQAIAELKDLKVRSLHALTESAQTLFYLSEKNLFPLKPIELRLLFTETIDKLTEEYLDGAEDISPEFDPALLWNQTDGELKIVIQAAQAAATKLENVRFTRFKISELKKLEFDPSSFVASLISTDSQIAHRACLTADDAKLITEILGKVIQQDGVPHYAFYQVGKAVSNRYSDNGFGKAFREESSFLELLAQLISKLSFPTSDQLLSDSIHSLLDTISKSLTSLSKQS